VQFLTDTDPKPQGYGGREANIFSQPVLRAIDYKTGTVRWSHSFPAGSNNMYNLLVTAGGLLFSGDPARNFIAFDPANGRPLWHVRLAGNVSGSPITYLLDGRQHLLVTGGDELYSFALPE